MRSMIVTGSAMASNLVNQPRAAGARMTPPFHAGIAGRQRDDLRIGGLGAPSRD